VEKLYCITPSNETSFEQVVPAFLPLFSLFFPPLPLFPLLYLPPGNLHDVLILHQAFKRLQLKWLSHSKKRFRSFPPFPSHFFFPPSPLLHFTLFLFAGLVVYCCHITKNSRRVPLFFFFFSFFFLPFPLLAAVQNSCFTSEDLN